MMACIHLHSSGCGGRKRESERHGEKEGREIKRNNERKGKENFRDKEKK
jgi:hypothetical protein